MSKHINKIMTLAIIALMSVIISACCGTCPFSKKGSGCGSGGCCGTCSTKSTEIKHLKLNELETIVNKKSAVILDARSGKWDDGTRIPGAKSLNSKSSAQEIAKMLPDKNQPVVTYCGSTKCPASKMLATKLKSLGYTNISEYAEGIKGWKAAGKETEKAK